MHRCKLSRKKAPKTAAVVVPLSNRRVFRPDEEISLRHLIKFLGSYDKYFIIPDSLQIEYPGFGIKRFDNRFFGTVQAHTQLMLSPIFYRMFADYEYILIYHLDSLVFSDQLIQWCEMDFDYIAPPWIKDDGAPNAITADLEFLVGNGGFSLRKVESFLKVIYSTRYSIDPVRYWEDISTSMPAYRKYMMFPKFILKYLKVFNNVRREMPKYRLNEDVFWATRARHFYPEFNIAPFEVAFRFAFESAPRLCFEKNNYSLPFGCHAWQKYDRAFWEGYLIS